MNRVLGYLALCGFLTSALVHAVALRGIDVSTRVPAVWLLHVGIFFVFGPFVFVNRRTRGSEPRDLLTLLPIWGSCVVVALFVYAFINFLVFMSNAEGGSPAFESGRYVLLNHGRLIREISPVEYAASKANELRGFSGHWMVFYFIPFCYFVCARRPNQSPEPTVMSVTPPAAQEPRQP